MPRLPRHHVPRPRLVDRLRVTRIGLLEAAGGYGKSVLAAEYAADLGIAAATAALEAAATAPQGLVEELRRALRSAGLSDLAQALADPGLAPGSAVDALIDRLTGEPDALLLVVDDVHLAAPAAGPLLARLASRVPAPHRVLLLGRRLPRALADLRADPEVTVLTTVDLEFRDEEIRAVLSQFGLTVAPHDAAAVARATAAWPAAVVLSAPRLAAAPSPDTAIAELGVHSSLPDLVEQQLERLEPDDRRALVEAAHLPAIDAEALDAAAASPGLLERLVEAGVPLAPAARGGWQLPGPVQEQLTRQGPLSVATARRIVAAYRERNRIDAALTAALAASDPDGAAALIDSLSPEEAHELDYVTLAAAIDLLTPAAIAAHPRVLVHFARACETAAQFRRRSEVLGRARELADRDPRLRREVDGEVARDLIRDGDADAAEALAAAALADAGPDEIDNRARALDVLGRAKGRRRDARSLAEAEALLEEAYGLYRSLGRRTWLAQIVMPLAIHVHFAQGRYDPAVARLDDGLAGLAGRSRLRAVILTFRAQVLDEAGRYVEADANLREARALGEALRDNRVLAYAAWEEAVAASQQGDAARTLRLLREAEARPGDWFDHETGAEFLAAAAEAAARVGEVAVAHGYLARAERRSEQSPLAIRLARGSVDARFGDAATAELALVEVTAMSRLEPREAWRVALFRAQAALRRGDPAAGQFAAEAFDAAEAIGDRSLPLIRERTIAEGLVALAADAGSRAAATLAVATLPVAITLLGRFEVLEGGRPIALPRGKPELLVKLVATSGGRINADEAIEAVWPDEPEESGRRGLRNVLQRLHEGGHELIGRQGDLLVLTAGVEVDAIAFEREARRALAARRTEEAAVLARSLVPRYRGDLLPDDPYEGWTTAPRERLRLRLLALLDVLVRDAVARRDLDEALRLLERAIEVDPYDEARYLDAARLLVEQGRRLRAIATLHRGRDVLASLGVAPPPAFRALERELADPSVATAEREAPRRASGSRRP